MYATPMKQSDRIFAPPEESRSRSNPHGSGFLRCRHSMPFRIRIQFMIHIDRMAHKSLVNSTLIIILLAVATAAYPMTGRAASCTAETADTLHKEPLRVSADTVKTGNTKTKPADPYRFKPTQLIIPATLIGVGVIGLESDWLKFQNREIRDELQENIDRKFTVDDFTQYAPIAAVYGLRLCGVKGRHGAAEQTVLLGTTGLLMGAAVLTLKSITRVERPDGSTFNSFPSGHTATAFMGAELLRREYRDVSPWIGVAGYAIAAGTGFFRMYNNRHWLTDVIAGAGIGILSVQIAYWLYPLIARTFFRKLYEKNIYISPCFPGGRKGIGCTITF